MTSTSCDRDGVLDNGETGRLTVTLKNQGPNNVNHVESDGHVEQPARDVPSGQRASFPPVQKNDTSTGSIEWP